ncbi:cardiolipin synthase [Proteocatella sphenisci]|uniref:cardiolipin synthase n=1 Tax=Proteocatella sphenisci TaxID=181070 RepID=UPI00068572C6|nr:cardiolipin synthase [Proteocatella sphenisci]
MNFSMIDFYSGAVFWFWLTLFSIAFVIFFERRNPSTTMTWLLMLIVFPFVGLVMYFVFGENLRKKNSKKIQKMKEALISADDTRSAYDLVYLIEEQKRWLDSDESDSFFNKDDKQAIKLLLNSGNTPVTMGNDMKIFEEGISKFESLLEDIKNAQKHIHLEYYIIKDDNIGNQLREALIERAKAGVKIKLLYDPIGCYPLVTTRRHFISSMRDVGIEVLAFMQDKRLYYRNINYRNHRKIVIIDGKIGYLGGINIGDEYVHEDSKFGFWRDTHLRFEGNVVVMLQMVFLQDWYHRTGRSEFRKSYFHVFEESKGPAIIQIAASGTDSEHPTIYQSFFYNITHAQKSVYIQSPYFVPDEALLMAIKSAVLSGVDVKIMFPGIADHFTVHHASHSYLAEIAELGAKVYIYKNGFIHSKVMMVDNEFASVGTANMDVRSFKINAEINALIYDDESISKLYDMYERDLKNCERLDPDTYQKKSIGTRFIEGVCRLFSPIL